MRDIHFWYCSIYPKDLSIYQEMNKTILIHYLGKDLNLGQKLVQAGYFQKGVPDRNEPDDQEVEVRNNYLHNVPHDDFLIIVDNDEQLCGDIAAIQDVVTGMMLNNTLVCWITEVLPNGQMHLRPRIIWKKAGMTYQFKHDIIMYKDENILDPKYDRSMRCPSIQFSHHNLDRFSFSKDGVLKLGQL